MTKTNVVDLDAARAARREAKGEAVIIRFGGEDFALPPELPLDVTDALTELQNASPTGEASELTDEQGARVMTAMVDFIKVLMGEEGWTRFNAHRPSFDDLEGLLGGVMDAYGMADVGESGASTPS